MNGQYPVNLTFPDCLFCHQPPNSLGRCNNDGLTYWSVEELHRITPQSDERLRFVEQHPNQPAYFFNGKYYTVSEMERIVKLKAFL